MRRLVSSIGLLLCLVGCDSTEEQGGTLLKSAEDVISVAVVSNADDVAAFPESFTSPTPTVVSTGSGELVAEVSASPRVVPIAWGESTSEPTTDFMTVSAQVEELFQDQIVQVELKIDVGSDGIIDWCRPMNRDSLVDGLFYIELQPGCTERDPLTDDCVIESSSTCQVDGMSSAVAGCRQDVLTFTMWDDISSECHDWTSDE